MPELHRMFARLVAAGVLTALVAVTPAASMRAEHGDTTVAATANPAMIDSPASASATALRGPRRQVGPITAVPPVASPALAGCDAQVLQRLAESRPAVGQWIVVVVPSTSSASGTAAIATVRDNVWTCTLATTPAMVGRVGIRPLQQRRSGDGTTPSGIFSLGVVDSPQGPVSFFGNSPDPGALGPYRKVQTGDCYGANPN